MFEIVLLLWLIASTALHIYSLKVAEEEGYESHIEASCREHGVPIFVGMFMSYLFTLVAGIPFFVYKLAVLVITNRQKEE